jgi:hypothetical protein
MHTVELIQLASQFAESLGYRVRQEWLAGVGGGACQIARQKHIFVDLSLSPVEQLDQLLAALYEDPAIHVVQLPEEIRKVLGLPARAA